MGKIILAIFTHHSIIFGYISHWAGT